MQFEFMNANECNLTPNPKKKNNVLYTSIEKQFNPSVSCIGSFKAIIPHPKTLFSTKNDGFLSLIIFISHIDC